MKKLPVAIFFVILSFSPFYLCAKPLKADVAAKAAILINAETGAILYEKNAHEISHPASITKIATALYALEKKSGTLEEMIEANHDAIATVSVAERRAVNSRHPPYRLEFGGTHMGIKLGEQLSLRALLYGLMLTSGNDAANVIAQYVSGSVPKFMEELDVYLKEIGCNETHFHTPHGLHYPDHTTTAYDMAKMTQRALKIPLFREIVKTVRYTRPGTNKQPEAYLLQHNSLLKKGPFYYPKAIGVKTGYTKFGGYTLVAAAEDENRSLIAVVLNCTDIKQRYKDAIALFEMGFKEEKIARKLLDKQHDLFHLKVKGVKGQVTACLKEDLKVAYYLSEEPDFKARINWNKSQFPIKKDQAIGEVCITTLDGRLVKTEPIYAVKEFELTPFYRFTSVCKAPFKNWEVRNGIILALMGLTTLGCAFACLRQPRKDS